jgi:hypothetical protein
MGRPWLLTAPVTQQGFIRKVADAITFPLSPRRMTLIRCYYFTVASFVQVVTNKPTVSCQNHGDHFG